MKSPEEAEHFVTITTEGQETVFRTDDGAEFRIQAKSGAEALAAFVKWNKARTRG